MSLSLEAKRTRVDTTLALCVAFTIVLLGLIVNFGQRISQFFMPHARFPAVTFLLNFLCAWLTVLLAFVFVRWRRTERIRREVESIISSISPDALLVVDCSRRIRVCNNSLVRMFGYTPGEILNRTTDLLYDDRRVDPVNRPREIYEALERDGYHIGTAVGRRKSGETFPVEIISAELSGREGAVLLLRDITERVRAAKEKERLEEQLRQREKLQSMGLMASGIAHDLNNFLTVVNGNTELARVALGRNQTATVTECLNAITEVCHHAAELCRYLTCYSATRKPVFQELDLSQLVRDTLHVLDGSLSKSATVELRLTESMPTVRGDPAQLRRVVRNLLVNAAEAIGEGGGTISVSTGVRQIAADQLETYAAGEKPASGRYAFLEVSDTGKGMTEDIRCKIFDPFFSTKGTARGLGLSVVLGVVRAHNGAVAVQSEPGKGTTFTVLFPLDVASNNTAPAT